MQDIREIEKELDRGLCKVLHYVCVFTDRGPAWVWMEVGTARLPEHLHVKYDPIWCALVAIMPWWPIEADKVVPGFEPRMSLLPPRIVDTKSPNIEKVCA